MSVKFISDTRNLTMIIPEIDRVVDFPWRTICSPNEHNTLGFRTLHEFETGANQNPPILAHLGVAKMGASDLGVHFDLCHESVVQWNERWPQILTGRFIFSLAKKEVYFYNAAADKRSRIYSRSVESDEPKAIRPTAEGSFKDVWIETLPKNSRRGGPNSGA